MALGEGVLGGGDAGVRGWRQVAGGYKKGTTIHNSNLLNNLNDTL